MHDKDAHSILNELRGRNVNRIIIAHLNINSIRNKFDVLAELITRKIDILLISETRINESFPSPQFHIFGYPTPLRLDRTESGGGLLLYIRDDIPSKYITITSSQHVEIECLFVEINLYKRKWLIVGTYNPCKQNISVHLSVLIIYINRLTCKYDHLLIIGDFNSEPSDKELQEFCNLYNLKNLVNEPTCYKNHKNPSCIDLIFTNRPRCFQNTTVVETGISRFPQNDHHRYENLLQKTTTKNHIIYRL